MRRDGAILTIIIGVCLAIGIGYVVKNHEDALSMSDLPLGISLLDLYEQNHDLAGWIRVPETTINYPVMGSEKYLHRNFKKKYEYRGTPFVLSDWDDTRSRNTMIFGHNMWAEGSMFNPLHKYEKESFCRSHTTAEFFVIRGKDSAPYVEKRTYRIHAVDLISVDDELYTKAQYPDAQYPEGDIDPAGVLFDMANRLSLYDTGVVWQGGDELTLSTCSYHIRGKRDAGRLLVFGTRIKTENKDL